MIAAVGIGGIGALVVSAMTLTATSTSTVSVRATATLTSMYFLHLQNSLLYSGGSQLKVTLSEAFEAGAAADPATAIAPSIVIQGYNPNINAWDGCKPASPNPSVCSRTVHREPAHPTGNGTSGADVVAKSVSYLQAQNLVVGLLTLYL